MDHTGQPRRLSLREFASLLQAFYQVQIREHSVVAEDTGLGVRGHQDGADGFDSGGIGGEKLAPQGAFSGLQIQAIDARGQLSRLIDVERVAVGGVGNRLFAGVEAGNHARVAASDGRSLYIYQPGELPASVYRLDIQTGKRTLWKQLLPSDPAGVETIGPILMTPDAQTCIFGYHRMLADLYLVEGLK